MLIVVLLSLIEFKCVNLLCELLTENEKEYGKGRLKYKDQKNTAWIGGAMDILDEEGDIVVSPTNMYRYLSTRFFFNCVHYYA
jgi:hypothetical protein